MDNLNNNLKQPLDARADNLYHRAIRSQVAKPERLKGCSEQEIAEIEQTYKLSLPYSYKVFLRYFGHNFGSVATDLEFLYPSPLLLTQWSRDTDREVLLEMSPEERAAFTEKMLPANAFIFAMKYRMESWFFIAEKGVEDPIIFYDLGDGETEARKTSESLFDFWEGELEFKEQIIAERRAKKNKSS